MAEFYYCMGIYLDKYFCEKTCKKRENCRYYDINIYDHYKHMWDKMDFLVCYEPCQYYIPRQEEQESESGECEDPFALLMQHDMK